MSQPQLITVHGAIYRGDHYECDVTIRFATGDERCSYVARRNDPMPVNLAIIAAIDAGQIAVDQPNNT